MGGAFSGYRDFKKRVVESCDAIDTSDLKRLRLLRPGTDRPGSLEWRRSGDEKASAAIGYTISVGDGAGTFRFRYQIGQPAERFDYPVQLVSTVCHLGGRRWWFVCPLTKGGVRCGRRVRKLYRCGLYFGCRHCHELVYRSSQQSDARVYALARARGRRDARHRPGVGLATRAGPQSAHPFGETDRAVGPVIPAGVRPAFHILEGLHHDHAREGRGQPPERHPIDRAADAGGEGGRRPERDHARYLRRRPGAPRRVSGGMGNSPRWGGRVARALRVAGGEPGRAGGAAPVAAATARPIRSRDGRDDHPERGPAAAAAHARRLLSHRPAQKKTREKQLRELRRELRIAQQELAATGPARDFFHTPPEAEADSPVPYATAEAILEAACSYAGVADDLAADPPAFGSKSFLRKLGLTGAEAKRVTWTPDLIRRGLEVYAGCAREEPEAFRREVGIDLDERAEDLARQVARLEREVAAVMWLLDGSASQKRAAKLLPGDGRDERIAKYERHLHTLLTSTLHELERLQARREGMNVPPPAVADVNVTVDAGAN